MESYISDKKNLYTTILEFLEISEDDSDCTTKEQYFEKLSLLINQNVKDGDDSEWMHEFLEIIKCISDNHHRDPNFAQKTQDLLQHYQNEIKQTMSNDSIFHLFADNKFLVHLLLKNDIITMTDTICSEIMTKQELNGYCYCHFFYRELENFLGEEKIQDVKKELLNMDPNVFDNYEEKCEEGENDKLICSLIRRDSVEEFIAYINRNGISISTKIAPSPFETNSFLISQKSISLIEYSAFFGSIQIYQYLKMNGAELTPSLWLYAIHSKNAELIHILESDNVNPKSDDFDNEYLGCFIESIKCHHNDFADYIETNFFIQEEKHSYEEAIICNSIKYHNYIYFETESVKKHGFFYLALSKYNKLADILLKENEKEINLRLIKF